MIIATDLDRTLLPNGAETEDVGAREDFFTVVKEKHAVLVYVTGRSKALFAQAQQEFGIETPTYLIGDVGTTIYKAEEGELVPLASWKEHLAEQNPQWDFDVLVEKCSGVPGIVLQEPEKLNEYKVSYYAKDSTQEQAIVSRMKEIVASLAIDAEVVFSVDESTGLIDVLPKSATKATALLFLVSELGMKQTDVVYAGDSGNDLLVFESFAHCVLVGNARREIKTRMHAINTERTRNGLPEVYLATRNYAAGIVEGLTHFA